MNRHRRLKADGGFEGVERIVDADFIWIPCFEFECISVLLIWPIKKILCLAEPALSSAGDFTFL